MRGGRKQQILSTTLRKYRKRFLKSSVLEISLQNHKDINATSFSYVTGLKNNSCNAIKVCKTKVTRSQRNGKDSAKMIYCRIVAARRLTTGSILNNLKL